MAKLGQLAILASALLLALAFPSISAEYYPGVEVPVTPAYPEEKAPATYPEEKAPATPAYREEKVLTKPAYTSYKAVKVVVEGIVYCQSCERVGTWSLTDAKKLPSAEVSVVCKDHKGEVSFSKVYEADKKGYFYAELEYVEYPLRACRVKLVASPDTYCSLPTNVNGGINGAPLRYENKRFVTDKYVKVVYAAGPVAFSPNNCSPPAHY